MSKRQLKKVSARLSEDKNRMREAAEHLDALHPARIGSHLPSNEEEYHKAEHQSEICDDTRRRGAGHISSSGGLILRPGGMGSFREFHDLYTREPEKELDRKPIEFDPSKVARRAGPSHRVVDFGINFCILCMKKDVPPPRKGCNGGNKRFSDCRCCSMLDLTIIMHSMPECNLNPGDQVRSVICAECKIKITQEAKNQSHLQVVHEGRTMPASTIKAMAIYRELKKNWSHVLRNARLEPIEGKQGIRAEGLGNA